MLAESKPIIMKKIFTILLIFTTLYRAYGQNMNFPKTPQDAEFVTSDIENFWIAFDSINISKNNPFERYIKHGTKGLQGFIPNRIMSADSLLSMVKRRSKSFHIFMH